MQLPQPVNKFPDFVRYIVRRLKSLCPSMGKIQIAQILARAGLHLGSTTVGRMLKEKRRRFQPPFEKVEKTVSDRVVTAKYANHVWHVDLTTVPTGAGYWCSWLPFALPQCWPFCYWVAIVIDHFSRRAMGVASFKSQPSSEAVRAFLGRAMHSANAKPRHLISDKGGQFWNDGFKRWCKRKGVKPRFGAVGKHGSICVVERFILTMKCLLDACCWCLTGATPSNGSSTRSCSGTTIIAATQRSAAARLMRPITAAIPPTASRDSNRARAGLAVRRAQALGTGERQPWRKADVGGQLPRWKEAATDRATETGRIRAEAALRPMAALIVCTDGATKRIPLPNFQRAIHCRAPSAPGSPRFAGLHSISLPLSWATLLPLVGCKGELD